MLLAFCEFNKLLASLYEVATLPLVNKILPLRAPESDAVLFLESESVKVSEE